MDELAHIVRQAGCKRKVVNITMTLTRLNVQDYLKKAVSHPTWIFIATPTASNVALFENYPASIILFPPRDLVVLVKGKIAYFSVKDPEGVVKAIESNFQCTKCQSRRGNPEGSTCMYCSSFCCVKCLAGLAESDTGVVACPACSKFIGKRERPSTKAVAIDVRIVIDRTCGPNVPLDKKLRFEEDVRVYRAAFAEAYMRFDKYHRAFHLARAGVDDIERHPCMTDAFWKGQFYPVRPFNLPDCIGLIKHNEEYTPYPDIRHFERADKYISSRLTSEHPRRFYVTVHHTRWDGTRPTLDIILYRVQVRRQNELIIGCWESCFGCGKFASQLKCKACGIARFCSLTCHASTRKEHELSCESLGSEL